MVLLFLLKHGRYLQDIAPHNVLQKFYGLSRLLLWPEPGRRPGSFVEIHAPKANLPDAARPQMNGIQ